jgi:hypothetical protein
VCQDTRAAEYRHIDGQTEPVVPADHPVGDHREDEDYDEPPNGEGPYGVIDGEPSPTIEHYRGLYEALRRATTATMKKQAAAAADHQLWPIRETTPNTTQKASTRLQNRFEWSSRTPLSLATVSPQSRGFVPPSDRDPTFGASRRKSRPSISTLIKGLTRTHSSAAGGAVIRPGKQTLNGGASP